MPLFRCSIRGENFPGTLLGEASPIGFHTTRFVEAPSPDEAEMLALGMLRGEDVFNIPPELRSDDAKVFFDEIVEVAPDSERVPNSGFSFFAMGT
jgi:hypothetical protein